MSPFTRCASTRDAGDYIIFLLSMNCLPEPRGQQEKDGLGGEGYADLKHELAEVTIESLYHSWSRFQQLKAEQGCIDSVLTEEAVRFRPLAHAFYHLFEFTALISPSNRKKH